MSWPVGPQVHFPVEGGLPCQGIRRKPQDGREECYCTQVQVIPRHKSWDNACSLSGSLAIHGAVIRARSGQFMPTRPKMIAVVDDDASMLKGIERLLGA